MRIAVIGLGWIGLGVSRLALRHGHEVLGFDVVTFAPQDLPEGLMMLPSPAAAADGADCVLIAVYDDAQVDAVLNGPDGILGSAQPGQVVTILSTVSMELIRKAEQDAKLAGVALVDCGVSGGHGLAAGQKLALAVGGDARAVERVRPALESFGEPVGYMGPLGSGMAAKLARNLLHYCSALVDFESARLASNAGVNVDSFVQFVKDAELKGSGHMGYIKSLPEGGFQLPGLPSSRYAYKDLQAALALGDEVGADLPVATLGRDCFKELDAGN